jgi:CO/xanthine dehydrogenase FAD-binding subunit
VALAGGTTLVASGRRDVEGVVDLRDLSLSFVRAQNATLYLGATTTLQGLIDTPELQTFASGVLAETASAAAGRNIRNAATIGGIVASAGADDPLLTALLALDTKLGIFAPELRQIPLVSFLAYRERLLADGALITQLSLPLLIGPLGAAYCAVGRTARDRPIVCAVARMELSAGVTANVRLALGGVGAVPVRANASEQLLERKSLSDQRLEEAAKKATVGLAPVGDFRGSAEYRREMAVVLARRSLSKAAICAQALGDAAKREKEDGDEDFAHD